MSFSWGANHWNRNLESTRFGISFPIEWKWPENSFTEYRYLEEVQCPICGPAASSVFPLRDTLRMVKCSKCGLIYVNARVRDQDIMYHFTEKYIANDTEVEREFDLYRQCTLKREALQLKRLRPQGGRLLDVGAAGGAFLKCFFGDPGWNVEGVEPNHHAASYARQKLGLAVHEGVLRDQRFPDATYDVVTCLDTFYFLTHPNEEISEMARILKPKGMLAIEIPGLHFRLAKKRMQLARELIFGKSIRSPLDDHLFCYHRKTLTALVSPHGLKILASYPEQSPTWGSHLRRWFNWAYFLGSASIYTATLGRLHFAPKELIIYTKA